MQKIWLKTYEEIGLKYEVDQIPDENSSLLNIFEESNKLHANLPAFYFMGKSITYKQFDQLSLQIACYLQSCGLQRGDKIAIMLPNILQYPIIAAGVLRAGYTLVNINPLYTSRELKHQLEDSDSKILFILENFASTYQNINKKVVDEVVICRVGDMLGSIKGTLINTLLKHVKKQIPEWQIDNHKTFKQVLNQVPVKNYKRPDVHLDDTALLQYTGGTTGVAKGAELSHSNLAWNIIQCDTYLGDLLKSEEQSSVMVALPLYHIFAFNICFLNAIKRGAACILVPNPRDLASLVKAFDKYNPHIFPGVNTLFNALVHDDDFKKVNFSNLKITMGAGMAVQESVAEDWEKVTGISIFQGYGLSETSPTVTATPPGMRFDGTIGLPLPYTEVAILDANGNSLPIGEEGEICIRGPQVMKGYWNKPEETAAVMTSDGFFRSGDIGVMDENGRFKIVDRLKDMILVSGFNVYPNELEEVLTSHPKILEAGVIGITHEKSGEVPKAFVVKSDDSLTENEVKQFCRKELTGYKQPRVIQFVDELPKSNVGKILRKGLRDLESKQIQNA